MKLSRRGFLKQTALAAASVALAPRGIRAAAAGESGGHAHGRFLLSEHGCGRATGYAEASRIVPWKNRLHVGWLDSREGEFRARVRTLDLEADEWSPTRTLGPAHDNHGGPALTVDSRGYLHATYSPHHHRMRYRRSVRPNNTSEWTEEREFGPPAMTYPTLVCGPDDTLYLTCRVSSDDRWKVVLFEKPRDRGWRKVGPVLESRFGGYAHFQEALAWGPEHRTLHLSCRIYEAGGRRQTVGYLSSEDFGRSWRRADRTPVELPATADTVDVLRSTDEGRTGLSLRCGSVAVDPLGRPNVLYSEWPAGDRSRAFVLTWIQGGWRLSPLPAPRGKEGREWQLSMPGGMAFVADGARHVALTALPADVKSADAWGHPAGEVAWILWDADGMPQSAGRLVSPVDPGEAHWLPNLWHPTGHDTTERPALLYTAGPPGANNRQTLANEVWFVRPEIRTAAGSTMQREGSERTE